MARNFVYADSDRTFKKDSTGSIIIHYDADAIIQSIRTIFSTISGERVRNPIGSTLVRLLFEPMSPETADSIRTVVSQSISRNEPRVTIQSLRVIPNYDRNFYDVQITLKVKKLTKNVKFETQLRSLNA